MSCGQAPGPSNRLAGLFFGGSRACAEVWGRSKELASLSYPCPLTPLRIELARAFQHEPHEISFEAPHSSSERSPPRVCGLPEFVSIFPYLLAPLSRPISYRRRQQLLFVAMDSEAVKKAVIQQVLAESNMANARQLIEVCVALSSRVDSARVLTPIARRKSTRTVSRSVYPSLAPRCRAERRHA